MDRNLIPSCLQPPLTSPKRSCRPYLVYAQAIKLPIGSRLGMEVFILHQLRHLSEVAVASFFWSKGQPACPSLSCPHCPDSQCAPILTCPAQAACLCEGSGGTRLVSDAGSWAKGFICGLLVGSCFAAVLILITVYCVKQTTSSKSFTTSKATVEKGSGPAVSTASSSQDLPKVTKSDTPDIASIALAQAAHFRKK